MLTTIIILIFTLIVVPILTFYYGTPLNDIQFYILGKIHFVVAFVALYCFVVGEITRNNSQVDKLWSIVPVLYVWLMTIWGDFQPRMILMSILVTIWGARLTYNFSRRGAYQWKFWEGEEDYRWPLLRNRPGFKNRWIWMLFNFFFISFYQNALIFLFTLPILTNLYDHAPSTLGWADYILSFVFVLFVIIEYIADQQQYDFQTEKYRRMYNNEPLGEYSKGFMDKGLWGIVRHPNYSMEQAIWIVFYGFSIIATGQWFNWSIAGCLLLVVLFIGSSNFSEEISASKYPDYKDYQKRVPRFIPFLK